MDKKTQTWLVLGVIGAGLAYLIYKDASTGGGSAITIAPGLAAGLKTPANGSVVLQLPAGGTWVSGQASSGTLTPKALPVAGGTAGALPLQVTPGLSVALQWNDSTGTTQNTFLTFA